MTGSPVLTFPETREPQAEAVIHRGLAAFNTTRFRPTDNTTLDILVCDDNSGEVLGGLLGRTSYRLFFLDLCTCRRNCAAPGSAAGSSSQPRTRPGGADAPPRSSIP
jgi:hypothetical protein